MDRVAKTQIPAVKAKLLEGKRGLIVGIANDQSIAWGCAKAFRAFGAELAVTYLNDKAKKYVEPLATGTRSTDRACRLTRACRAKWKRCSRPSPRRGESWILSSIRSPSRRRRRSEGRVTDVSRDGFLTTMEISCWTFIRMAHLAEPLMRDGGTLFTMTYYGSQMVVKNYNIMGVAKAALESAVRYLAAELGPKGNPRPRGFTRAAGHPRRIRHSRIRRTARKGQGKGTSAQSCQHRRRRRHHRFSGPRRRSSHHRRNALHRRRLSHRRLGNSSDRNSRKRASTGGVDVFIDDPVESHWPSWFSRRSGRMRKRRRLRPRRRMHNS